MRITGRTHDIDPRICRKITFRSCDNKFFQLKASFLRLYEAGGTWDVWDSVGDRIVFFSSFLTAIAHGCYYDIEINNVKKPLF